MRELGRDMESAYDIYRDDDLGIESAKEPPRPLVELPRPRGLRRMLTGAGIGALAGLAAVAAVHGLGPRPLPGGVSPQAGVAAREHPAAGGRQLPGRDVALPRRPDRVREPRPPRPMSAPIAIGRRRRRPLERASIERSSAGDARTDAPPSAQAEFGFEP